MDVRLRVGIPSRYLTSCLGQLSLAVPSRVGAVSTGDGYGDGHRWVRKRWSPVTAGLLMYRPRLLTGPAIPA